MMISSESGTRSRPGRGLSLNRYADDKTSEGAWEIAVKVGLGKLHLPSPPMDYVPQRLATSGTAALPGLPLMTADAQLAAYDVEILAAR